MKEYVILKEIKDLEYEDAYKAMFNFMYGLKYDDGILRNDIGVHFDVYRVASEYKVGELQKLAFEKVKKIAYKDVWDVKQFVKILKKDLADCEELYEFLIDTCHKHIVELANDYGFEERLEVNHPIATGLVLSWGDHQLQYCCPSARRSGQWTRGSYLCHHFALIVAIVRTLGHHSPNELLIT